RFPRNLVRSHASGLGPAHPAPVVRATMAVRAFSLAQGRSAVRPLVVETLVAMLNAGIHPVVPETGSVGASGDLVELAHVARALMGEGEVEWRGMRRPAAEALAAAGVAPVVFEGREALALMNGTACEAAQAALLVLGAEELVAAAEAAAAPDAHADLHDAIFQAQPPALAVDHLEAPGAEVAPLLAQRLARPIEMASNCGLPPSLLSRQVGLRSGLIGLQYCTSPE